MSRAASPEAQHEQLIEALDHELWSSSRVAVPSMVYMSESDGPVFSGWSYSCDPS
ncbi:hypothetical protein EDD33_1747 [Nocardioides aurantiacus]|uniref:Uncharacterized protein n=1 Tax=Nocardioides aurantiacus TaxID=86796 RepID=A0A3N2CU15_9ACTN|nr:hypothetical protein EDD33_1747 [Nocardioides aurantiacus]